MKRKKITNILIIVILVIIIEIVGYFILVKNQTKNIPNQIPVTQPETSINYVNSQYGFNFLLPLSWKGYSIVNTEWEGYIVDGDASQNIKGPKILIRHPLWTAAIPRQDIPILIFTPAEWDQIQQEKLAVSAAPIGPSRLGQNAKYIFALPARYNFAYPVGFEEVEKIMESKPLSAF